MPSIALPERLILLLILAVGVLGAWTYRDAASDYTGAIRAYTRVQVEAQPESFAWTAPDYSSATLTLTLVNDSAHDATAESLDVQLRFNGDFAGSNYEPFTPVVVPAGESRAVTLALEVTTRDHAQVAPSADVTVDGAAIFRFAGIKPSRSVDLYADLGRSGAGAGP
jgi:hypothetical protein